MNPEPVTPLRSELEARMAALRQRMRDDHPERVTMPPRCGRCEDTGWETLGTTKRNQPVMRCRNGCEIPVPHHLQRKSDPRTERQTEAFD